MHTNKWLRIVITLAVISQMLISYGAPVRVAAAQEATIEHALDVDHPILSTLPNTTPGTGSIPLNNEVGQIEDTTLSVSILSSPWAILDANDPQGIHGPVPQVLVVEGQVTNVGASPATNVVFTLDYNEDPANDWILLPGEDPERTIDSLAPGAEYHAYWFARYALVPNSPHQYTISALADNAPLSCHIG